jgi:hypothetical protein
MARGKFPHSSRNVILPSHLELPSRDFLAELMDELRQQLETFLTKQPVLGCGVYLAKTAVVVGDVTLGDYSSVWYHAVLRGDINRIDKPRYR